MVADRISSQYVSSVLMSAPYASHPDGVRLTIAGGKAVSMPYIDMTVAMMKSFGVEVTVESGESSLCFVIPKGV